MKNAQSTWLWVVCVLQQHRTLWCVCCYSTWRPVCTGRSVVCVATAQYAVKCVLRQHMTRSCVRCNSTARCAVFFPVPYVIFALQLTIDVLDCVKCLQTLLTTLATFHRTRSSSLEDLIFELSLFCNKVARMTRQFRGWPKLSNIRRPTR